MLVQAIGELVWMMQGLVDSRLQNQSPNDGFFVLQQMPEARELHIDLIPFLEKNTSLFMKARYLKLNSTEIDRS